MFRLADECNGFQFIDRIEYLMKMRTGWSVSPQRLEMAYRESNFIAQIFVYTDYRINCLVAVVVPNENQVAQAFEDKNSNFCEVCKNPVITEMLLKKLAEVSAKKLMKTYEFIKDVFVEPVP